MKWLKNLENLADSNTLGNCPYCESEKTKFSVKEVSKGFGYGVVWCDDCKRACNISRISISPKSTNNVDIPTDLIFGDEKN